MSDQGYVMSCSTWMGEWHRAHVVCVMLMCRASLHIPHTSIIDTYAVEQIMLNCD